MPEDSNTVTMSKDVLRKLIALNRDARKAIEPAGGNSVQLTYRNNCITKLDEQLQVLEIFPTD